MTMRRRNGTINTINSGQRCTSQPPMKATLLLISSKPSSQQKEARDKKPRMPIHVATENGQSEAVEMLLDKGAQVDATDGNIQTALHIAAARGNLEIVDLLLDERTDRDLVCVANRLRIGCYSRDRTVQLHRGQLRASAV
jgi:ankyrin repeat protein